MSREKACVTEYQSLPGLPGSLKKPGQTIALLDCPHTLSPRHIVTIFLFVASSCLLELDTEAEVHHRADLCLPSKGNSSHSNGALFVKIHFLLS